MKPNHRPEKKQVIIQVVQHLRPGGIETMALDLLNQLQGRAEIYIFSLEGTKEQAIKEWPRLANIASQLYFFNKKPGLTPILIARLIKRYKSLKAAAIHSHHIGPLLYAGVAAKWLHIPQVHTEHDAWHLNATANRRLQRILLHLLKPTLVADCDAVAEDLCHYFPHSKPEIILNGIDTHRFLPASSEDKQRSRNKLKLPNHGTLIGCAARLESVKGHEFLLKALSQTHADISLALAGSGSLRKHLEQIADSLGIRDRVYFLGQFQFVSTALLIF